MRQWRYPERGMTSMCHHINRGSVRIHVAELFPRMAMVRSWDLPESIPLKVGQLDATFLYGLPGFDQTLTPIGECATEVVVRKAAARELAAGGRLPDADRRLTQHGYNLLTGQTPR